MEPAEVSISNLKKEITREVNLPAVEVGFTNLQSFDLAQRAGKLLASSTLVPKEFQGNLANCVIALNMASRIGADPLMVMQNLYIVYSRPSWSSQFLIATFNSCGKFSALRYEWTGTPGADDWGCMAWAIEKSTGEKLIGAEVSIALAKKEGWYAKSGSKWQSMPQQMLMYRAASWFIRAYAPELAMGLHTAEEVHDVGDVVQAEYTTSSEQIKERVIAPLAEIPEVPVVANKKEKTQQQSLINPHAQAEPLPSLHT